MTYEVIARKWRPQSFEEVTGQEHITRTLRNAIENARLHHAYLFSGARGVGKTTTARLLAKALNCHRASGPTATPCRTDNTDACASCREIAESRSIDVLEIDAASNTGVDNVRDTIIDTVGVRPARDRYKVFIIDEVHMLSNQAFNALLKTLEEPPPSVLFIMATTASHKVPDTILSRSQQFEFRTIPASRIAARLRLIADAEKVEVSDAALREIARAGEGSMRDSQSAFDQVISFSEGKIDTSEVEAALGLAGREMLARVMRAIADGQPAAVLAVVDELVMRGHELRNFCRDLMGYLRDLLLAKVAGDSPLLSDVTEAERSTLVEQAKDFSESDLVRFFHSLTTTEENLREGAHPRYQVEIGLVKLVEMRRLSPLSQVIERLNALEEAIRTGKTPTDSPGPSSTSGPASAGGGVTRRGGAAGGGRMSASASSDAYAASVGGSSGATDVKTAEVTRAPAANATSARESSYDLPPFPMEEPPWMTDAPSEFSSSFGPRAASQDVVGRPIAFDPAVLSDVPKRDRLSPGEGDIDRVKHVLESRRKALLVVALDAATHVTLDRGVLCAEFGPDNRAHHGRLDLAENKRCLQEVCREVTGRPTDVRIVLKGPQDAGASLSDLDGRQLEQNQMRELAENDPLVKQVLKTFRAEIVDIRRRES
jgi:DNA polymerase-3 subunit gamma/tau